MMTLLQTPLPEFDPSIAEEFGYAVANGPMFLGVPVIDTHGVLHMLLRFVFNLVVSWIVTKLFYYRKGGKREYFFTFMLFSSAMFLLLLLLGSVSMQIGLTIGLFAIFGMIRYRTETVPVREMTYLFVIIALSVINGIGLSVSYAELGLANLLVLILIWFCENFRTRNSRIDTKIILYDRIALIVPEKRAEMIEDLKARTGLNIVDIEIGHIDFLRDAAYIKISYKPAPGQVSTIGHIVKPGDYV